MGVAHASQHSFLQGCGTCILILGGVLLVLFSLFFPYLPSPLLKIHDSHFKFHCCSFILLLFQI